MSLNKFITFGFIALATLNLPPPAIAQTQSTCSPEERKQFALTAVDKEGGVIESLRGEHLRLKVGGSPATISEVVFHAKYPMDLAVLIDTSTSQEVVLPIAKAAARAFVTSLATQGQDRVAVVSFADTPVYLQSLTSDLSGTAAAIDRIEPVIPTGYIGGGVIVGHRPPPPGSVLGSTSLWDTVASATTELFRSKTDNRRRAVLLFTDGRDTSSLSKLKVITEQAIKHDVAIFAIGLVDPDDEVSYIEEHNLKKLSEQTGGVARYPGEKKVKLEAALTEIGRRLRGSYVVGYCGGAAKERPKLQLEVVDPEMRKAKPVLTYKRYQQ